METEQREPNELDESELTDRFRAYLQQPGNFEAERKVYSMLKGTEFAQFQRRGEVDELVTKFKMMRSLYRKNSRKKWHQIEKEILLALISKACGKERKEPRELDDACWREISAFMLWDAEQCRKRWLAVLQQLEVTPWTEDEDAILYELVAAEGKEVKWVRVS